MRRIDQHRSLAGRVLRAMMLATFISASLASAAQQVADGNAAVSPPLPCLADPLSHVTPEDVGDSLLVHRQYQQAIDQYRKASSDSPDVWNKMGIAYQMLSDLEDAERCYKESLRLRPLHSMTLNNLGTVYDLLGNYLKAQAMYRQAFELDPTAARIALNLGTNLMIQGKYRQGSDWYKRAVALDPRVFDQSEGPVMESGIPVEQRGAMNYYKARNCAQAGLNDRAIKYLEKALSEGFTTPGEIARDSSFAALRDLPAFQRLLIEQRNQ